MTKFQKNLKSASTHLDPSHLEGIQIDETITFNIRSGNSRDRFELTEDPRLLMFEHIKHLNLSDIEGLEGLDDLYMDYVTDDDLEKAVAKTNKKLGFKASYSLTKKLKLYLQYLKKEIKLPCYVTGSDEFDWEEEYLFSSGRKKEYQKQKINNPSYQDTFEILSFVDKFDAEDGLKVEVRRVSDEKLFTLVLADLECTDEESDNYELIEDYSIWFLSSAGDFD
ncbi:MULTISPECIES: calcium-binding protein [Arthrospira]|jgi:hypothetical protein|uniref:Uncharacterized protein n=1 Tax=Limnospira platensis NIES-46 TaxID=1236695 RepID=A0A5M3T2B9_LIMPL|nr:MULTISPECIES: calcium-binding protein [Arthrospira]AMW29533.1 hypothetical protein AP285_18005 [Arthrospira platensis YZ]KDR56944.1 hypothetical protein APPUASWS_013750 [Arthrospira platensis str. Paraca]MBD2669032.1 hypothetical protein [Arthrospira platensis FACHB-439]MBD2709559.1 hypothetical protein [Arthrospira platensis FACHB-835]MDF2212525.1 calcium-binding protein [Arthrospira platensis NCB002]MDT9181513.1 calcium-binding protein [Limnospira sp. PMC 289.06]MDT9294059.1 calcium-bin